MDFDLVLAGFGFGMMLALILLAKVERDEVR